jgi:hypothetical protein
VARLTSKTKRSKSSSGTAATSWRCDRCGERYFDRDTMRLFEETRQKVGRGDLEGLRVTGELLEPIPR